MEAYLLPFTLQKATIHQVTTMLTTSKMSYFQVITTLLITSTDDPNFNYRPNASVISTGC